MSGKPVTWAPFAFIAAGGYLAYKVYEAWKSGVIAGRQKAFWSGARYYDRSTQPGLFWLTLVLWLAGASYCLVMGLRLLLAP